MSTRPVHWLLLRGLGCEPRRWCSLPAEMERCRSNARSGTRVSRHGYSLPAELERALPGSRAHRLALPGAGTERRRPIPAAVAGRIADVRARWLVRRAHVGRRALAAPVLAVMRYRAPARLGVPALVVVGGADRLTSPACGRALAARFDTPVRECPEAGHDIANEASRWLVERLAAWCDA